MKIVGWMVLLLAVAVWGIGCHSQKKAKEQNADTPAVAEENPASRLHDIWVLEKMAGMDKLTTTNRPRLELFPEEGRIAGNASCNEIFGQMQADAQRLSFSKVGATKRFCRDLAQQEGLFLSQLEKVDAYTLKGLTLIFLSEGKELMVFRKVD
ncbi:MAG: META domain-containing protein [Saprospiraceae bacterium]